MSDSQVKNMSKNEIKNMLMKMGVSLDKNEHEKSYYENLYLKICNKKNKRTRSNNLYYREQFLKAKRERNDSKSKKKDKDDIINEEKNSIQEDEENNENENLYNESDESNQDTEEKKTTNLGFKKFMTKEIIELNKNYKESGIKYTRLIPIKKKISDERKSSFTKEENEDNNKTEKIPYKENESINNQYQNVIIKNSPLKQSYKDHQNNVFKNSEIISNNGELGQSMDNRNENVVNNDTNLQVNEIKSEEKSPQQNQVLFGVPKNSENNYNINLLSNGPISFGFNPTTNSKNFDINDSNKDKDKRYNAFVKNVSEAVKNNINESQISADKKAKTILLKWESPKQKEFISRSMDMEDNYNNLENEISASYNFNERLNQLDNEVIKIGKGLQNKKEVNLSENNYIHQPEYKKYNQGKNIQDDDKVNDYKLKLRSFDKNRTLYNNKDNNDELNIKNPFYTNDNLGNNLGMNYMDSQDIYGKSNVIESNMNSNLNPESNYSINNNINKSVNTPKEEVNELKGDHLFVKNSEQNVLLSSDNNPKKESKNKTLEEIINYDNKEENINLNAEEEKNIFEDELEINNYIESQDKIKKKERFYNKLSGIKNTIMNKFKKKIYLWPLLLLILFGILYFLNNSFERFDNSHIIIVFSILMGLLVLYNILRYLLTKRNYKKLARADRIAFLERINNENITTNTLMNNAALISNFINSRSNVHNLDADEYMKYVFPYLKKYLKKDGFEINIENNENDKNREYWKKIDYE